MQSYSFNWFVPSSNILQAALLRSRARSQFSNCTSINVSTDCTSQNDEDAFEALQRLSEAIELYKNPTGSRQAPARTCMDLALSHPELQSGECGQPRGNHEHVEQKNFATG